MTRLSYNGLRAILDVALTDSGTTITFTSALEHSGGTAVPTVAGGDYIPLALIDPTGALTEIVHLTAYVSGATTGTVTRGAETTDGVTHDAGDIVACIPTVGDFNIPGPQGDEGPIGLPGVNAVENDTAVAGYIAEPTSDTAAALSSSIDEQVADPDGVASTTFIGTRKINFVQDGDSIGWGSGATDIISGNSTNSMMGQVKSGLDNRFAFRNVSVPGSTAALRRTNGATNVDVHLDATPGVLNVCSIHAGTNDLFFSGGAVPVATVQGDLQGWVEDRLAAGWDRAIVHTLMPRTDAGTPVNHEAKRLLVNTWLRDHYATFAHALADTGGDSIMGDVANTTGMYFDDLVHPTNAGYRRMATYVRPLLAAFGVGESHVHRDQYLALRRIWIPATEMIPYTADLPTLTHIGIAPAWLMPKQLGSPLADVATGVCFSKRLPDDWEGPGGSDGYGFDLVWCNAGTASGNVRFDFFRNSITDGVSVAVGNASVIRTQASDTTANLPKRCEGLTALPVPKSRIVTHMIQRSGSLGSDTLSSDIYLLGIDLYRWTYG